MPRRRDEHGPALREYFAHAACRRTHGSTSSTGASKGMTFAIWGPWEEGAL